MNISGNTKAVSLGLFVFICVTIGSACSHKPPEASLALAILSSKPHLVSGGDALIQLSAPEGIDLNSIELLLNHRPVELDLSIDPTTDSAIGLLSGLNLGNNIVEARSKVNPQLKSARITLNNHAITGPIVSGPHLQPFICQTSVFNLPDGSTLGEAIDDNCSVASRVDYVYFSNTQNAFVTLPNSSQLPDDVALTTTTSGLTRPFVVRLETRTINRGIYQSSVLHDPSSEAQPKPSSPPIAWNKRLLAVHGFGCPTGWFRQGNVQGVNPLDAKRLGEGYALFTNTLNHPTNSCNPILAGETTMMGKEYFIESIGIPDFTVSIGSSGGAYTSLQIADAFPGLFDGVLIGSTFPDALSIALSALDAHLLADYFLNHNSAALTESQAVAISGYKNARAWYDIALQSARTDPVSDRQTSIPLGKILKQYRSGWWATNMPKAIKFSPQNNPEGARATIFDVSKNIYGTDPKTGYGMRPFDNTGVQYGLQALNNGVISVPQFIDINANIGGYDDNANPVPTRSVAFEETLNRTYKSGISLSGGGGLANIPVFDLSHLYDEDELYHYQWFHFAVRERMRQNNGHSDNHVMWRAGGGATEHTQLGGTPSAELVAMTDLIEAQSWQTFIEWVSNYKADKGSDPQLDKVISNKPPIAVDGCFTKSLTPEFIAEPQTWGHTPTSVCNKLWPSYSFVRKEAGGPLHANTLKCQRKPLDKTDYRVQFNDQQWTAMKRIFKDGVCDWSQPGVAQAASVSWLSGDLDFDY